MEAENPVQPTDAQRPVSWWSLRRVCAGLFILFAVILVASWWLIPIVPYATLKLHDECGLLLFSPDGTMLVTSGKQGMGRSEGPMRVWDVAGGKERFSIAHPWKAIETVLFSPDSSLIAAHEMAGDLKVWNTKSGKEEATLGPQTKFGNWVNFRFSPEGRFLVFQDYSKGSPDESYITFWNTDSKQEQGSVESYFHTLAFASDGNSFATFRRKDFRKVNEVLLWKTDQTPVLIKQHQLTASVIAFSPDLQTFASADDLPDGNGQVAMWDMTTGEKRWSVTFNEHGTHLQSLSFIANGKVLSAHGGGGTKLGWRWRTTLWNVTSSPREIGSFSETPAVSPDGEWVAIPLDSGVKLINASSPGVGTDLVVSDDLGPSAFGIYNNMKSWPTPSFSPDSKMVLVKGLHQFGKEPFLDNWLPQQFNPFRRGSAGSVIRVWDTDSRREVMALSRSRDAWFSTDGHVLATLRDSQEIDLWIVPLRASLWRILGWSFFFWLIAVSICWLGLQVKWRFSHRSCRNPAASTCNSTGKSA
jgi:WD40 repeat protein